MSGDVDVDVGVDDVVQTGAGRFRDVGPADDAELQSLTEPDRPGQTQVRVGCRLSRRGVGLMRGERPGEVEWELVESTEQAELVCIVRYLIS